MSIFKTLILILLVTFCIAYIFYTRNYYVYCNYAKKTNNYLVKEELTELYILLCESTFKDYSNHTIMKYSLDILYSIFTSENFSEFEKDRLSIFISTTNFSNMKYELKVLKSVHLVFYMMVLYALVIYLPKFLINLLLYIIDKLLFVLFLVLVSEAVLNLYMDLQIDLILVVKMIYSYLPLNWAGGWLLNIF